MFGFCVGFLIASIPMFALMLASPEGFIFGNLGYPRLNTLYRLDFPAAYAPMRLTDKVGYLWNSVISQPPNLLLGLSFLLGASILGYQLRRGHAPRFEIALALLIPPFLGIGSFLPTPSWYQYFNAPVVFGLIAVAFGLAYLARLGGGQVKWVVVAFTEVVVAANLLGLEDYRQMRSLLLPDTWRPLMFHNIGVDVRGAMEAESAVGGGCVLTLGPLYPLEAGLDICPAFATGPFAWRVAPYLDEDRRKALGVISAEELSQYLADSPPAAILVGVDRNLERDFVGYAEEHGYHAVDIGSDLQVWVRPKETVP